MPPVATAPVRLVIEQLQLMGRKVRPGAGGWTALCPAHDDRSPSFKIDVGGDGRALLRCHRGCHFDDILRALNLTRRDLFDGDRDPNYRPPAPTPRPDPGPAKPREYGKLVKTYDYTDADGVLVHQTCRYEPKSFAQRVPCERPDTCGYTTSSGNPCKGWHWTLKGIEPVLYNLPGLIEAIAAGRRVYVVEGEKDADALEAIGLTATTCPMGAKKWRDSYTATLAGAHVVYLPDNDLPGEGHAARIAHELVREAASVRILNLPGLPPKGDSFDWLKAGGTAPELERLVEKESRLVRPAPRWKMVQAWTPADYREKPKPV